MDAPLPIEAPDIELVLYEVGGRLLGSDAAQVLRVARRAPGLSAPGPLGAGPTARRALVVQRPGASTAEVPIDRWIGLERVRASALRRVPEFVLGLAEPALVGFLLRGGDLLVPLIDLEALVAPAGT